MQEEYANIQEIWRHHLDLLDHRRTELQDHYVDQGGDLKVFYSVLQASRLHQTPINASSSAFQGSVMEIKTKDEKRDDNDDSDDDEEGGVAGDEEGREDSAPVKTAANFISQSAIRDAELPLLPQGFEDSLQVSLVKWSSLPFLSVCLSVCLIVFLGVNARCLYAITFFVMISHDPLHMLCSIVLPCATTCK